MIARRCKGDGGQVGGIEVLPFGFLIFVAVTLLFANVWGVIDAKLAVTSAAREATRAFVEAPDIATGVATARLRATESLDSYGRGGPRSTIADPVLPTGFTRCGRVRITVSYQVPALAIPFLGGFGQLAAVQSTHTELIDPFRSGLPGPAQC